MRILLTGFMAAGKTTVGRELARLLGMTFCDLDEVIVGRAGRSIGEVFTEEGEEGFREREERALAAVLENDEVVVALGGGTLVRAANRRLIRRSGRLVWLNPSRSTILARLAVGGAGSRPLFESPEQAMALFEVRLEHYKGCDLEVRPAASESAVEVAKRIVARLRTR